MGSAAAWALVGHVAFWVLIVYGRACEELTLGGATVFVGLWLLGAIAIPHAPSLALRGMLSTWVAVLDIGLVFAIFKGDVRIS